MQKTKKVKPLENNDAPVQAPAQAASTTKTVLVCTPTIDGKLDAWYVNSLYDTILLCARNNILVKPIFLAYESILPMARNECFKIAFDGKVSDLVFIDADTGWQPEAFLEIIMAKELVIALPCRLKTDDAIIYNVKLDSPNNIIKNEAGYLKAISAGTGFLKINGSVVGSLWKSNVFVTFKGKELKNICEYGTTYADFVGEDTTLCNKIRELGYDIWINPKSTCIHLGTKIYAGDFLAYFDEVNKQLKDAAAQPKNVSQLPAPNKQQVPATRPMFDE